MTFGRWLLGVAMLAAIAIALVLGARAVRRRWAPGLDGPTAVLADAILAISALVVVAEMVGVVGLLDAAPLVVGSVIAGAGGIALGRGGARGGGAGGVALGRGGARGGGAETVPGGGGIAALATRWVALAAAALVFAAWVRRTLVSLDLGVGGVDSLWYHLPFAAKFAQTGSVAHVPYVDLEFLTAFYPANVELVHAVGMVLFGTAALSPLVNLAALALGLLAGWCLGRPFGQAPLTLLATALVLGVPALFASQAGEAKNDVAALAFLLAAAALLATTRRAPGVLAIAGAAAGLALGTKLSFLAPVAALFVLSGMGRRRVAFAAAAGATGGYWYLRNLFATGNPLPWLGPLPQPAEARSEETATSLADYLFDGHAWSTYFLPALDDVLGPAWWALVALAAVGALAATIRGEGIVRVLGVVAIAAAAAYVITPTSAAGPPDRPVGFGLNVRYALPAILLGLALLPIVLRRWTIPLAAALAVLVAVTQLGPEAIWHDDLHRRKALAVLVVLIAGAVAVTLAPRPLAVAAAAAAAVGATLGLWPLERDFLRQQYTATRDPYTSWQAFRLTPVYAWARQQHGARIAVTGTTGAFLQFPLNGPELDNEVELLGDHGPHGSFTPSKDCTALVGHLDGHTHVVVTPYLDIWDPFHPGPQPELKCLANAHEILRSGDVRVFDLP